MNLFVLNKTGIDTINYWIYLEAAIFQQQYLHLPPTDHSMFKKILKPWWMNKISLPWFCHKDIWEDTIPQWKPNSWLSFYTASPSVPYCAWWPSKSILWQEVPSTDVCRRWQKPHQVNKTRKVVVPNRSEARKDFHSKNGYWVVFFHRWEMIVDGNPASVLPVRPLHSLEFLFSLNHHLGFWHPKIRGDNNYLHINGGFTVKWLACLQRMMNEFWLPTFWKFIWK